jgi:anti-sigma B factor antagonist
MTVANEIGGIELWPREASLHISVQAIRPSDSKIGPSWVVHVSGNVDWTTSSQLRDEVSSLIRSVRPSRVILDLAGVTHLDSSGIGALLASLRDANQRHVAVRLAALSSSLRGLLERTQLHTVFDIRPTVQDALRA